ncbi:MAG: DNA alkylation repair protein [Planctomycetota bacterium]|nr:DNA alkylation repair protein [Planctomycetota bacterium]
MGNRPQQTVRRIGASRMADIPLQTLRLLNAGKLETANLVEWLAIDQGLLLQKIAPDIGLGRSRDRLNEDWEILRTKGVMARIRGIGTALDRLTRTWKTREAVYERLASHRSDCVREWAAFMDEANPNLSLRQRLRRARRFAIDPHFGVRECAWSCVRPHLADELDLGFRLLMPWVLSDNPLLRRFAIEGTRPRGVWTRHLKALVAKPAQGLPLLEPCKSDPNRYVQDAVANWLNDAGKSAPDWVEQVCSRWSRESRSDATRYIVRRAQRRQQ